MKELRQDPANDVQIQECSIPQKRREECKWYKIIERVRQAIIEYTELNDFKPSSRTMFYQMQDEGLVTKNEQSAFVKATVEARLGWVDPDGELYYPKLDIDCFADDDSRKSVGYYDNGEPTDPTAPGPIPDPDDEIDWLIRMLKAAPNKYTGRGSEGEPGRPGGRWYNQTEYVEVWEEKVDLLPGFEKTLGR